MPRKRRIHRRRRWTPLQLVQLTWPYIASGIPAFADDAERRECWGQSRERLLAKVADLDPNARPVGWWLFERAD